MSDRCPWCGAAADLEQDVWCPSCNGDLVRRPTARVAAPSDEPMAPATLEPPALWHCATTGCDGTEVPVGQACPFCDRNQVVTRRLQLVADDLVVELSGGGPWTLGRETPDTPQLAGAPTVSRRHASIAVEGPRFVIADLGSTNGTFVDGQRLDYRETRELRQGSSLRLGQTVELLVDAAS